MAAEKAPRTPRRGGKATAAGTIHVTLARSPIGHTAATRGTIRALGLRRLHQTVQVADTPETRGMLRRAAFLLRVEEPAARRERTTDEEAT